MVVFISLLIRIPERATAEPLEFEVLAPTPLK
jgi:hypothetical protein